MRNRFRKLEIPGSFERAPELSVRFDGRAFTARAGESLALALLAHGERILGRSGKYHRPRGLFCGRGTCGNCVARINGVPNQLTCTARVHDGMRAKSQHTLGSARFDWLAIIDRVFARGLDHHRLLTGSRLLNRLVVAMARRLGGMGELPDEVLAVKGPPRVRQVDVAVVGAGPAGAAAAEVIRAAGLETLALDAQPSRGDGATVAQVIGLFDDRELVAIDAQGQLRVRAARVVVATGANEQAPPCAGNDRPGVLGRRAAESALAAGVLPGERVSVALCARADRSTQRRAQALADQLNGLGVLAAVVGLPGRPGTLAAVEGSRGVRRVVFTGEARPVACDALVWCATPAPAYELASQMGVSATFDAKLSGFVPAHDREGRTARAGVYVAGEVCGIEADHAAAHGRGVGEALVRDARLGRSG